MSSTWKAASSTTMLMNWWGSNQLFAAAQKHAQDAAETAANLARKATELAEQAAETAKVLVVHASEEAPKLLQEAPKLLQEAPKLLHLSPQQDNSSSTKQAAADAPSMEEFLAYGVTDDLITLTKGLTYSTFSDFPPENLRPLFPADKPGAPDSRSFQLSPWQERHARLILQCVPQLQDLRFVLCPRRMSDEQFWTIYFNAMCAHLPHQAFGWHGVVDTRPPLAPRPQQRTMAEVGRAGSIPGHTTLAGATMSPMHSAREGTSVADSSSLVIVDKWSETEGEQGLELEENDADLDAYLREALTIEGGADDTVSDDVSNAEDLDDYLDQLDQEIQDAANKREAERLH